MEKTESSAKKNGWQLLRLLKTLFFICLIIWIVYSLYVAAFESIDERVYKTNGVISEFKAECIKRTGRVRHDDGNIFCSEKDGSESVFNYRNVSSDIGLWSKFLIQVSFGLYVPTDYEQ